ncbi:MAG TPA: YfhO family protein [Acidobacteriota bacterium]
MIDKTIAHSPSRLELTVAFLAIALQSALFLAPALFTSKVLLPADLLFSFAPWAAGQQVIPQNANLSDALQQFYPYLSFFREQVRSGHFPLWNPYVLCGTPFVANVVSAVLFPITWLVLLLPADVFFEWSAFLKLSLGGIGIYLFARESLHVRPLTAWCATAAYCFSGYFVYFLSFPNSYLTMLLPWCLVALERGFVDASKRARWFFSFLAAALLLSGHVESAALFFIFFLLYLLVRVFDSGPARMQGPPINIRNTLIPFVFHTIWGGLLAAAGVWPFLSYLQESATLPARTFSSNPFFVSVLRLPAMWIPYFFGSPVFNPANATIRQMEQCIFLGAIPLMLMFYGMSRRFSSLAPSIIAGWLFSLVVVFGVPPFFQFFTSFPLLKQANHIHAIQIFQLCAILLFAVGLERWSTSVPKLRILPGIFLALQLGLLLWQWFVFERYPFLNFQSSIPWYGLIALLLLLLFCLTQFLPRMAPSLLAVLLPAFGFLYGFHFNPSMPRNFLRAPAVLRDLAPGTRVAGIGVGTLLPNMSMSLQVGDLRGYEPVVLARTQYFFDRLTGNPGDPQHSIIKVDQKAAGVLKDCGVEYLLSPTPLMVSGWTEKPGAGAFLYQSSDTVSPAVFFSNTRKATPDESLDALLGGKTREALYLESASVVSGPPAPGSVQIVENRPDHRQYSLRGSAPGYLLIRECYADGWSARVNGKSAELIRANYLFMAVAVSAGDSTIDLRYRPWSWIGGLALTVLSLPVVLGGIAFRGWKKPPRRRVPAEQSEPENEPGAQPPSSVDG